MRSDRAIVIITTSFPICGDGSEAAGSFVSDLAEEMAKHVPVRVVAPGAIDRQEHWNGDLEVFRFAAPDKPLSTLKPWNPADLIEINRVLTAGEKATRNAVSAGPVAHILALWALPSGHWARRASREFGIPYSVWTLGSDIWSLGRIPFVRGYLRRVLRGAHTCYSDGIKLAENTRSICGREVEFLPSTRKIERSRSAALKSAPPYRLLYLGRWHANKGVDLLLDALESLNDTDWLRIESVQICGGGPLEDVVRCGVKALCAKGRAVELFGYLNKVAAEEALLQADYLLIPSRVESIPLVFSDAMKLGCAVVATPVGDFPALFARGAFGVLSNECSMLSIRTAISAALHSPITEFANALNDHAMAFDLSGVAVRLLTMAGLSKGAA